MNCKTCAHAECAEIGGNEVYICGRNGAIIGIAAADSHWCRHWADKNDQR